MKLIISILIINTFFSVAQTEAITKDGRKVLLYKNGTWKYAKVEAETRSMNNDLKKEASEFAMQLVRSYFAGDCNVMQQSLAPEVFTFNQVLILTEEHRNKICESVKQAITDTNKTYKDYELVYKIEFLSKAEVEAKAKSKLPAHFNTAEQEFYFIGFEQKTPGSSTGFISDRLFAILIRKVDGKWQVKGFLND